MKGSTVEALNLLAGEVFGVSEPRPGTLDELSVSLPVGLTPLIDISLALRVAIRFNKPMFCRSTDCFYEERQGVVTIGIIAYIERPDDNDPAKLTAFTHILKRLRCTNVHTAPLRTHGANMRRGAYGILPQIRVESIRG